MNQCSICLLNLNGTDLKVTTPCNHNFHLSCFIDNIFISNTCDNCPICRFQFGETKVPEDEYDEDNDEGYIIDIFSNLLNCNLSNKSLKS